MVQVRRKLVVENPAIPELKSDLYAVYKVLANLQRSMGKEQEALRSYRLAREILENLPRETPQDLYTLAAVYGSLAEAPEERRLEARRGRAIRASGVRQPGPRCLEEGDRGRIHRHQRVEERQSAGFGPRPGGVQETAGFIGGGRGSGPSGSTGDTRGEQAGRAAKAG